MSKIGKCALCLADQVTLKNSHIIPEFKFTWTYNEKRQLIPMSLYERSRTRLMQKGWREYLLCQNCEERFAKWEDYAAKLTRKCHKTISANPSYYFFDLEVDHRKLWLFGLSLLWRMGVCSIDAFAHVKLEHREEQLRQILTGQEPPGIQDYSIILIGTKCRGHLDPSLILTPFSQTVDGFEAHNFLLAGLLYTVAISTTPEAIPEKIELPGDGYSLSNLFMPESSEMKLIRPDRKNHLRIFVIQVEEIPYINERFLKQAEVARGERPLLPPKRDES